MGAAKRAGKACRASECAVQAFEQADERIAQHSMRRFHAISTVSAVVADWRCGGDADGDSAVHGGMNLYEIDAFISLTKTASPRAQNK